MGIKDLLILGFYCSSTHLGTNIGLMPPMEVDLVEPYLSIGHDYSLPAVFLPYIPVFS